MTFWKTVRAYLTGWVIAQSLYNRLIRHYRQTTWEDEKTDLSNRFAVVLANRLAQQHQHCIEIDDHDEFAQSLWYTLDQHGLVRPPMGEFRIAFSAAAKEYLG